MLTAFPLPIAHHLDASAISKKMECSIVIASKRNAHQFVVRWREGAGFVIPPNDNASKQKRNLQTIYATKPFNS